MGNRVVKTYTFAGGGGTFTAPGGVKRVKVSAFGRFTPFAADGDNVGMIAQDGVMYCWGGNTNGQAGNGAVAALSAPTAVSTTQIWKKIFKYGNVQGSGTEGNAFAVTSSGILYGWGKQPNGQLGVGSVTPLSVPTIISSGLGATLAVAKVVYGALGSAVHLLTNDSKIYSLGVNTSGGLGVGDVTPRSSPTLVLGSLVWADLVAGPGGADESVLGLTTAGVAYGWGKNSSGQLGVGDVTPRSSPVAVLGGLTFASISGAGNLAASFYGITSAGVAYAWGANLNGQLGVGDVTPRSSPVAVLGSLTFSKIVAAQDAAGTGFSALGLTTGGLLYAWGINTNGQLGVGDVTPRSSPVAVLGGLTFSDVFVNNDTAAGGATVFAVTSAGVAYAWGANANGQLGVGDVVPRSSPVAVLGGIAFATIYPGSAVQSVYGLSTMGIPYGWGANGLGQLGTADQTPRSSPVLITGSKRSVLINQVAPQITDIDVVPGTSYTVALNGFLALFGTTVLGSDIYQVQVEYVQ